MNTISIPGIITNGPEFITSQGSQYGDNTIQMNSIILITIAKNYVDNRLRGLPSHIDRVTINGLLKGDRESVEIAYSILAEVDRTAVDLLRMIKAKDVYSIIRILEFADMHFV